MFISSSNVLPPVCDRYICIYTFINIYFHMYIHTYIHNIHTHKCIHIIYTRENKILQFNKQPHLSSTAISFSVGLPLSPTRNGRHTHISISTCKTPLLHPQTNTHIRVRVRVVRAQSLPGWPTTHTHTHRSERHHYQDSGQTGAAQPLWSGPPQGGRSHWFLRP